MTSFGWKKMANRLPQPSKNSGNASQVSGGNGKKRPQIGVSDVFNTESDSDDDLHPEVDWLHQQMVKRSRLGLEDVTAKAVRLKKEGAVLAESERYWEAVGKWDEALDLFQSSHSGSHNTSCFCCSVASSQSPNTDTENVNQEAQQLHKISAKEPPVSSHSPSDVTLSRTDAPCPTEPSTNDHSPAAEPSTNDHSPAADEITYCRSDCQRIQCAKLCEMKAQVYMELREDFPAVQAAQETVELSPLWHVGFQTLGRAQAALGELHFALRSFSRASHLCPWDEEVRRDDLLWAHHLLLSAEQRPVCCRCETMNPSTVGAQAEPCGVSSECAHSQCASGHDNRPVRRRDAGGTV